MKKSLLLLFAAFATLAASAHDFEVNGIYYHITSSTTAEVTYKGSSYEEYWNEYSGTITIPATVTHEGVNYSVTSIGMKAFYSCSSLTDITIPESVTSIGEDAFAFCSSLTTITIPEGVTSIGSGAFWGCSSLTTITLPKGVTSIGYEAFRNCSSLADITIPESVTSIGEMAFRDCSSLTAITIPESVTSIGEYAFQYCSSLTTITIPENSQLTSIGDYAFSDCSSLTTITIPEGVTSIGQGAFSSCSSLTAITIPESVTSIEYAAFSSCSSLITITLPASVTSIGNSVFFGCIFTSDNFINNSTCSSENNWGASLFEREYDGMFIENNIVVDCRPNVTIATIPEGVTSIGEYAFRYCSSLTAIVLPKNLKNIYTKAFANCSELLDVYCYAEEVPSTGSDAFDGSYPENVTLHVPASALNAYKSTAPWSSFGNIIVLEDEEPLKKCATPTIGYADGKVVFACDTEGATVKSSIKENVTGDYRDMEVAFIPTYTITAYAIKEKHEDSDVATLTLCWIPCTEEHESEEDGILNIPSKPVLISTQGGTITVSRLAAGTAVAAYSTAGTQLATATATDGAATLATNLEAGSITIVKMGDYSIRIAIK